VRILFFARGEENLGVEYLSAVLKQRGHETALIFDPGFEDIFFMKSRLWRGLFSIDAVLSRAARFQPDLLAFTSVTLSYGSVRQTAAALKAALGLPAIIGGPHATTAPEGVITEPCFDMVCIGEGDEALAELADRMDRGESPTDVRGIWFKRDGDIIKNPVRPPIEDLDALPFPDKALFYRRRVFRNRLTAMTGRGCPFDCSFCINSYYRDLYGGRASRPRRHSVERVIAELKHAVSLYPIKRIRFYDDIFTTDRPWLESFTERYRREIGLPYKCNVSPTTINEETARLLREGGCTGVSMGIQSGNDVIRRDILDRKTSGRVIEEAARTVKKSGLRLLTELIFCLPGETREQMWETAALNQKLRPHNTAAFNFYPFPGARLTQSALEGGHLSPETYRHIVSGETGTSTWNRLSLLDHPHRRFANNIKSLIPLFSKLPRFTLPLFKRLCAIRSPAAQKFFFFTGYPFFDTVEFRTKLRDYLGIYFLYRKEKKQRAHPSAQSEIHARGNMEA
jgi:radical SAM superfamily enzyme YgiQ (UPF0313 family)